MTEKIRSAQNVTDVSFFCSEERGGEVLPLVLPPPWPPPGWGEVLPLVLGLHGDDGLSGILLHGHR